MIRTEALNLIFQKTKETWEVASDFFSGVDDFWLYENAKTFTSESTSNGHILKILFDGDCNILSMTFERETRI